MSKIPTLIALVALASFAFAQKKPVTEFVVGDGFARGSFGRTVEFAVDLSQRGSGAVFGNFVAVVHEFPAHPFLTITPILIDDVTVKKKTATVTGLALVQHVAEDAPRMIILVATFEDNKNPDSNRKNQRRDRMTITLLGGRESFSFFDLTFGGEIVPGDVSVGKQRG